VAATSSIRRRVAVRYGVRLIRLTEWRGEIEARSEDDVFDVFQAGGIVDDDETVTGEGRMLHKHNESITMEFPPDRGPEQGSM
jgi:hypothetical protein